MFKLLINLVELCKDLKEKISTLEKKNKALKIEVAELKERLGLNSKNSSIPSSKELYKIMKDKLRDEPKEGKKIGGQVGHDLYPEKVKRKLRRFCYKNNVSNCEGMQ